jgi:hypothetical protein
MSSDWSGGLGWSAAGRGEQQSGGEVEGLGSIGEGEGGGEGRRGDWAGEGEGGVTVTVGRLLEGMVTWEGAVI